MNSKRKRSSPKGTLSSNGTPYDLFGLKSSTDYNTPTLFSFSIAGTSTPRYVKIGSQNDDDPFNRRDGDASSASSSSSTDTPKRKKEGDDEEQNVFACMPTSSFEEVAFAAESGLGPLVPSATSPSLSQPNGDDNGSSNDLHSMSDDFDDDYYDDFGRNKSVFRNSEAKKRRGGGGGARQNEYVFEFFGMDADNLEKFAMSKSIQPRRIQPGRTENTILCTYVFSADEAGRSVQEVLNYRCVYEGNVISVNQVRSPSRDGRGSSIFANGSHNIDGYDEMMMPPSNEVSWKGSGILSLIFAWLWNFIESFFGW